MRTLGFAHLNLKSEDWYVLEIRAAADRIECSVDGRRILSVRDASLKRKGAVGLTTQADARTYFDELSISEP